MAFASVGDRGGSSLKVSGATISQSPSVDVPVGALLAVFVAWDNNNASSGDGPLSTQISCTDSVGNLYLEMFSGQGTGATARAHGCIFVCKVAVAITTADSVTVRNHTSLKIAKAISLWEFSMDADSEIGTTEEGPKFDITNGSDPAPLSLSSLASREYLILHVLAAEGPSSDSYTWDPDYTQITSHGTSGGLDDSNMTVNGGFRIATLTGDTVDVTAGTPTRDYVQGLQAIFEYRKPDIPFPFHPVLDDFNRADEDPLAIPPWKANGASTSTRLLAVQSNVARRGEASGSGGGGGMWWDQNWLVNDQEAYCTIATVPASNGDLIWVAVSGDGGTAGLRHARGMIQWSPDATRDRLYMGGMGITGTANPLMGVAWRDMSAGKKMGIRRIGTIHEHWIAEGGDWFFLQAIDRFGAATGTGYIATGLSGTTARIDDFGGGPGPFVGGFIPQIIRRVFNE